MKKNIALLLTIVAIVVAIVLLNRTTVHPAIPNGDAPVIMPSAQDASAAEKASRFPRAHEITMPSGFVNGENIKIGDYIGKKVILLDFWTYSCINCQRTLPYLNAWQEKYNDQGLQIISIHTPEFEFEKNIENVKKAVTKFGIKYPVVLDNDYGTWGAYGNQYWPRKYLIDIDGFVTYDHIGEGGYDETEKKIQEALAERASVLHLGQSVTGGVVQPANVVSVDPTMQLSPETYFGASRNEYLANGIPGEKGLQSFVKVDSPSPNQLYLAGQWDMQPQYAETKNNLTSITYRFQGTSVYFVASALTDTSVTVLLDGKPISANAGADITMGQGQSTVRVRDERLYEIINGMKYGVHTLELIVRKPGLRAYAFTFG